MSYYSFNKGKVPILVCCTNIEDRMGVKEDVSQMDLHR